MLQFRAFDFPLALPMERTDSGANRWFELINARDELRRCRRNLASARARGVYHAERYWEEAVCRMLDRVWAAQENFKAVRRHFV